MLDYELNSVPANRTHVTSTEYCMHALIFKSCLKLLHTMESQDKLSSPSPQLFTVLMYSTAVQKIVRVAADMTILPACLPM